MMSRRSIPAGTKVQAFLSLLYKEKPAIAISRGCEFSEQTLYK